MNKPYTVTSTEKQFINENAGDYAVSPVSEDVRIRLAQYAKQVQVLLQKAGLPGTYTAESIKWLSERINSERTTYGEDEKTIIANLFGSFLGATLFDCCANATGRWVNVKQAVGVEFQKKGFQSVVAFPITRVFKQIEHGDEYSIYSYYLALQEGIEFKPTGKLAKQVGVSGNEGSEYTEPTDEVALEKIRSGHRLIIFGLLANFISLGARASDPAIYLSIALIAAVMAIMGLLRLASGLRYGWGKKALLVILQFFPLINMVVLVVVSLRATKVLRAAGYKVGFFGAAARASS